MFGWIKRRKQEDRQALARLMQAAAEGEKRAKINSALETVGIILEYEEDDTLFCVNSVSSIVKTIAERAGDPIENMNDDGIFVAGIFAFTASDYLSQLIGAQFEMITSIVIIDIGNYPLETRKPKRLVIFGSNFEYHITYAV